MVMLALHVYLIICALIFGWFILLGIHDFMFQPVRSEYLSNSFKNSRFWVEAFWMSCPVINLVILSLFIYLAFLTFSRKETK